MARSSGPGLRPIIALALLVCALAAAGDRARLLRPPTELCPWTIGARCTVGGHTTTAVAVAALVPRGRAAEAAAQALGARRY